MNLKELIDPCVGCADKKESKKGEQKCFCALASIHQARLSERKATLEAVVKWLRDKAGKYSFDSFDHENATGNVNRGIIKALNKLADELEQSIKGGKHD